MNQSKLRWRIAMEAARSLFQREESQPAHARIKAARRLSPAGIEASDWPTPAEIREVFEAMVARPEDFNLARPYDLSAAEVAEADRFRVYQALLAPLERVRLDRARHPEGDALYHSLQVFDLARDELPYDEEFLLAALLHDVGLGIDPWDHVRAGLDALDGFVTERTQWLIDNLALGGEVLAGTIGMRARRRLAECESYEELMLLCRCDRAGRRVGVRVPEIEDALNYVRELATNYG